MTERGTPRRKPRSGPEKRFADHRSLRDVDASAMMRRLVEMEDDIVAALAGDALEDRPQEGAMEPEAGGESAPKGEERAEEPVKTPLFMELVGRQTTRGEILQGLRRLADAVAEEIGIGLESWEGRLSGEGEDDEAGDAATGAGEVGQGPEN